MRWVAASVLLFALPSVCAEPQADLQALSVSWSGADHVHANLFALGYDAEAPESWTLQAQRLTIDQARTQAHVDVPEVAWADTEPEHEYSEHRNVQLTGEQAGNDHFLYATPTASDLKVVCVHDVKADPTDTFRVPDQVQRPNPNPEIPTTQTLYGQACSTVQLCGQFTVALWSWKAVGRDDNGTIELQTGRTGPLAESGGPSPATQAYLTVESGCLTTPSGTQLWAVDYAVTDAALHLSRPAGLINGAPATGNDLELEGTFQATIRRANPQATGIQVQDGIRTASLDGQLAFTTFNAPAAAVNPWRFWPVGLAAIGSLAAGGAATFRRRPRPEAVVRDTERARNHLLNDRPRRARRAARRALHCNPKHPEALALRADALVRLGHLRRARRDYLHVYELMRDDSDALAAYAIYQAARCACALGQSAQALHYVQMAAHIEPQRAAEARDDPDLADLALVPAFQDLVNSILGQP
jgi:hypothetical protein